MIYAESLVYGDAPLVVHRSVCPGRAGNCAGLGSGLFSSGAVFAYCPRRYLRAGRHQFYQHLRRLPLRCGHGRVGPHLPAVGYRRHAPGRDEAGRSDCVWSCRIHWPDAGLAARLGGPCRRTARHHRRLHLYSRSYSLQIQGRRLVRRVFSNGSVDGLACLVHPDRTIQLAAGVGFATGRFSGRCHSQRK